MLQVEPDGLEILVIQVALETPKERRQPAGVELPGVLIGDGAQLLEADDGGLELVDGAREYR